MSSEQEKRELIKAINSNNNLSDKEKRIKIQQIMMGNVNFTSYDKCLKSNFEKTCEHYNKKCYKFHFAQKLCFKLAQSAEHVAIFMILVLDVTEKECLRKVIL